MAKNIKSLGKCCSNCPYSSETKSEPIIAEVTPMVWCNKYHKDVSCIDICVEGNKLMSKKKDFSTNYRLQWTADFKPFTKEG